MLGNVAFAGMRPEHLSTRRIEMKIAVTSQNRKTITSHAGKCRKFWVYEVEDAECAPSANANKGLQTFPQPKRKETSCPK
jgi:hypothetical protein